MFIEIVMVRSYLLLFKVTWLYFGGFVVNLVVRVSEGGMV